MYKSLTIFGILVLAAVNGSLRAADNSQSALSPSPRIVGGFQTNIDLVPSAVALLNSARVQLDGDLFQAQFCGGTVIASRWVLTAAHCVVDLLGNPASADSILVLSGSADLDNPVNQPIPVVRIISHPEYRSVEQGRDIALLQLEYEAMVQPIALNTIPVELNGTALIVGWGAINSIEDGRSQSFPKQLRGAFVNTTPGTECGSLFPDYRGYTDGTNICAGIPNGGRDSCQGDSGGPLYRIDVNENRATAISGITSWGIGCGVAANPGIYTNVAAYIGWIQDNLRSNSTTDDPSNQPANDDPQSTTPAPSSNSLAPDAAISEDEDEHVFSGALWLALLPLLTVLVWRRGINRAMHS